MKARREVKAMREAREGGEEGEEAAPAAEEGEAAPAEEDVDIGEILYSSCEGGGWVGEGRPVRVVKRERKMPQQKHKRLHQQRT